MGAEKLIFNEFAKAIDDRTLVEKTVQYMVILLPWPSANPPAYVCWLNSISTPIGG